MKIRAFALSAAVAGTLISAQPAQADAIDDALAKLPAGEISCEQAEKYWTNDADYNAKVRQARTIARFDSRGPQILDALARVENAANRCGLKGTTGGNQGNTQPAQPAQKPAQKPAPKPAQPAPKPAQQARPLIVLAPQGVPTFDAPVANVATVRLPDLAVIAQQLLAQYGQGSSLPL
ncbi:hypothetical protein [Corynebacterium sp. p3-SID1056]|mgnify:CR=1 FL=1|uniref:hypothetical protein n=1 Tax=Corynebacterium sp. p3-SID1056 TaxID=2916092 RepID=UPI0021A7A978|nr:hypothetical protein [Corynebacterium sp. p3-SID1056]MCT2338110.1 hypothetical protein [Corynebacterium sp. p3-SID1056]